MPDDEVELSDESLADSDDDIGLASDVDEVGYDNDDPLAGEAVAPGSEDLSGFADEAGDGATYGFENAYDTGSFQAEEAARDDLLRDANLQDSGEYTLPEDALIEGPELAEEADSIDPDDLPPAPQFEGAGLGAEDFASEISDGLDEYEYTGGEYSDGSEYAEQSVEYTGDEGEGEGEGDYAGTDAGDYADAGGFAEGEYDEASEYGEQSYDGEVAETDVDAADDGSDYADAGGYADASAEYDEGQGGYDESGTATADYDGNEEGVYAEDGEGEGDLPNRPGQIAKSALDDIFARAKKLKDD